MTMNNPLAAQMLSIPSMGPNSVTDPGALSLASFGQLFGGGGNASSPGATPNAGMGTGLGWNIGTGQLAVSGLGALGNIWSAFQANNLARKQFDFTKRTVDTNLANQIKSYNTALEDRARVRAAVEGNPAAAEDYVARNRLTRQ